MLLFWCSSHKTFLVEDFPMLIFQKLFNINVYLFKPLCYILYIK